MSTKQNEKKRMPPSSVNEGELRRRAEEKAFAMGTRDLESLSPEDSARLLNELQARQIELEMQNEELEALRARFFDLYDLAPSGYVSLSENSLILEANLTAATLLGLPKMVLIKTSLSRYILPDDQDTFYIHCRRLFKTGEPQVFEIRVIRADGGRLWVRMEAHVGQDGGNGALIGRVVMNDITDCKGAEEQMRHNEEDLNRAQSVARTGSWRLNIRRNKLHWSDESYRIFGIAKGMPMTYEKFLAAVHPADREFVDLKWKATLRGELYDVEHRILAGGKLKWVHEKAELEFDDDGALLGGFGTSQDITARKQAEEALRESKERFHRLFEDDLTGNFFCTPEGLILECNPAFAAIFGFSSPDEAVGANIMDLHIDPGERVPMLQALKKKGKLGRYEAWRKRRDGELIHIMGNVVGHFNDKGELYEINGYIFDDTERKRAEEALLESKELFEKTFVSQLDAIFLLDASIPPIIINCNPAAVKMFGYNREELLGSTTNALHVNEGALNRFQKKIYPEVEERGFLHLSDFEMKRKDGEIFPTEHSVIPLQDDEGRRTGWVSVIRDSTERKEMEEKIRKAKDELELRVRERTAELERKNQDLQEFSFVASHDLNEPLRKIQTFGSLLREESAERLCEQDIDYISRMMAAADRMRELLDALLRYSRVESRGSDFIPMNMEDIVQAVTTDLEVSIERTGAQVEIRQLPIIEGDPSQWRQVFQNLIANALKYHRSGVKPVIKIYGLDGTGSIFVKDNGIGFDEKYLNKIFQPFQRLHGKNEYSGTGIGLAICKKIIERHGGTITARSTPGKGSTFIVTLPVNGTEAAGKPE